MKEGRTKKKTKNIKDEKRRMISKLLTKEKYNNIFQIINRNRETIKSHDSRYEVLDKNNIFYIICADNGQDKLFMKENICNKNRDAKQTIER